MIDRQLPQKNLIASRKLRPTITILVSKGLSPLIRGKVTASALETPVYFMTDDDPSKGLNQDNFISIPYNSVVQPGHIETVITRSKRKTMEMFPVFR